jgi:hypothetical protein
MADFPSEGFPWCAMISPQAARNDRNDRLIAVVSITLAAMASNFFLAVRDYNGRRGKCNKPKVVSRQLSVVRGRSSVVTLATDY